MFKIVHGSSKPLVAKGQLKMLFHFLYLKLKWLCSEVFLSHPLFGQVMSRHSWKDQAAQPKVKYFTQVKSRPPTFVAFVSGKTRLSDTDIRFLTKALKEDFDLGGIPIRIMQRTVERKVPAGNNRPIQSAGKVADRILSDKRSLFV